MVRRPVRRRRQRQHGRVHPALRGRLRDRRGESGSPLSEIELQYTDAPNARPGDAGVRTGVQSPQSCSLPGLCCRPRPVAQHDSTAHRIEAAGNAAGRYDPGPNADRVADRILDRRSYPHSLNNTSELSSSLERQGRSPCGPLPFLPSFVLRRGDRTPELFESEPIVGFHFISSLAFLQPGRLQLVTSFRYIENQTIRYVSQTCASLGFRPSDLRKLTSSPSLAVQTDETVNGILIERPDRDQSSGPAM